ncbi:SDR family NAD(P)-dependent oxidoreductase [Marinobacter hydrocarbonoclasticus]|nr:SDR family NAD(P)-dependent oxidoreductase [Marinobacter nauticus]
MGKRKKVVLVTGANGGIGEAYCRQMLQRGYRLIVACRSESLGQALLARLQAQYADAEIELMLVDIASLDSIAALADAVAQRHRRLDVLVHNAGIYYFDSVRRTSADDIELNMAVHAVGPYALTMRLLPLLIQAGDARVISVSSSEHRGAPVDPADLLLANGFEAMGNTVAYGRSKWAALAMTFELNRRFLDNAIPVKALAAHPGVSITGIQHKGNPGWLQRLAIAFFGAFLAGKPHEAALPLVMASTAGEGGQFFGPTGFKEMKGQPGLVEPDPLTTQPERVSALWRELQHLSGLPWADRG